MKVAVFYFSHNAPTRESVAYKNTLDLRELSIESSSNIKRMKYEENIIQSVFWSNVIISNSATLILQNEEIVYVYTVCVLYALQYLVKYYKQQATFYTKASQL